jgi:hypothetical protein
MGSFLVQDCRERLRRKMLRQAVRSSCGEFATFGIDPPRGEKLIEILLKMSKVGPGICGWGLLRQRPLFVISRYSKNMTGMPVNFEMRRARSGEGRALPLRTALRYTGCVSSFFAISRCFCFKVMRFIMA